MQLLKQEILEDTSNNISNEPKFMPQQPVAAICDMECGTRYWPIGFYLHQLSADHFD